VILPFVDERKFLTVARLVLPLHEVAVEPLHAVAKLLHATAGPIASGASPTKTSCLRV
jgi:hypothetical protein